MAARHVALRAGEAGVGGKGAGRRREGVHVGGDEAGAGGTASGAAVAASARTGMPMVIASSRARPRLVQRYGCR